MFQWTNNGAGQNAAGGTISSINSTFDSSSKIFTWDVSYSDGATKDTDGFWLVVSPGPNPKGHAHEFGIIYFDASSIGSTKVTVYRYNGQNADNSYTNPGHLLASSLNPMDTQIISHSANQVGATRNFSVSINASVINSLFSPPTFPDWTGIEFGNKIGVWFHTVKGLNTAYDANGALTQFSYGGQGWHDLSNQMTVPAPGAIALVGAGTLLVARRRRTV
jgi:hypothetical protein